MLTRHHHGMPALFTTSSTCAPSSSTTSINNTTTTNRFASSSTTTINTTTNNRFSRSTLAIDVKSSVIIGRHQEEVLRQQQTKYRSAPDSTSSGASTLLPLLCDDMIVYCSTYLDAPSLSACYQVNRRLRLVLMTHDEHLWRPTCAALWSGRHLLAPALAPYVRALRQNERLVLNATTTTSVTSTKDSILATTSAASPACASSRLQAFLQQSRGSTTTSQSQQQQPLSTTTNSMTADSSGAYPDTWRRAFVHSISDAKRPRLTLEELATGPWTLKSNVTNTPATTTHPTPAPTTIPTQTIVFRADTRTVRAANDVTELPFQLFDSGRRLQIHLLPPLAVSRCAHTWCWRMSNAVLMIESACPLLMTTSLSSTTATALMLAPILYRSLATTAVTTAVCEDVDDEASSSCLLPPRKAVSYPTTILHCHDGVDDDAASSSGDIDADGMSSVEESEYSDEDYLDEDQRLRIAQDFFFPGPAARLSGMKAQHTRLSHGGHIHYLMTYPCAVEHSAGYGARKNQSQQDVESLTSLLEHRGERKFDEQSWPRCAEHLLRCGHPSKPP